LPATMVPVPTCLKSEALASILNCFPNRFALGTFSIKKQHIQISTWFTCGR
jgi:hypothetical protein